MKYFFKNNIDRIFILFLGVGFQFFLSFFNDILIFYIQGNATFIPYTQWWYILGKLIFFILLLFIWNKLIFKINLIQIRLSMIYFTIMFAIMLIIWPGIWRWDEMITLGSLTDGFLYHWQHWLSGFYYYICLQFIPCPGGVVLVQLLLISLIIGNSINKLYECLHTKWVYLMFVPLFFPAVIDNNFYPIRSSICTYIEFYLIFELIFIKIKNKEINILKFFQLGIITAIAASFRTENIIYIIFIPIVILLIKKQNIIKFICFFITSIFFLFIVIRYQNVGLSQAVEKKDDNIWISAKEMYELSGFIVPFGNLISLDFNSNDSKQDLEIIDQCISVEMIQEQGGLYAFWNGGVKSLTKKELSDLKKIYIKLIFYNMRDFIKERVEFFLLTNGFDTSISTTLYASDCIYDDYEILLEYGVADMYQEFRERYLFNRPISASNRKQVINLLEGSSYNSKIPFIFYNTLWIIILLFFIGIIEVIRKNIFFCSLIVVIYTKCFIVFLAAPATLFMYYFSTWLIGGMLISFWIIINRNKIKNFYSKRFSIINKNSREKRNG